VKNLSSNNRVLKKITNLSGKKSKSQETKIFISIKKKAICQKTKLLRTNCQNLFVIAHCFVFFFEEFTVVFDQKLNKTDFGPPQAKKFPSSSSWLH